MDYITKLISGRIWQKRNIDGDFPPSTQKKFVRAENKLFVFRILTFDVSLNNTNVVGDIILTQKENICFRFSKPKHRAYQF